MNAERDAGPTFPILNDPYLRGIPWTMIQPHEKQALANHGQTLNRLAQRHGLSCYEDYAIMVDKPWQKFADQHDVRRALCHMIQTHFAPKEKDAAP